jgi:hypothetical protein
MESHHAASDEPPGPDRGKSRGLACISATKWKLAPAANKFNWKTLMVIPLNYSNPRAGS